MEADQATVFLVDDDPAVLKSVSRALRKRGLVVQQFGSAQAFLENYDILQPGCLVLDLSMPGASGLELQAELSTRGVSIPIIFITGHGDISQSVQALKGGAVDFFEKPLQIDVLLQRIVEAFALDRKWREADRRKEIRLARFNRLTAREAEVLQLLISGPANLSNKEIARKLGISHRTVERHRARVMEKTQTRSIVELAELVRHTGYTAPTT